MNRSVLSVALFLAMFGFYLSNAAPSVTTGDSGEFMTAAATLSLPHAPSFPLYMLAGKVFVTLVPFGSTPFRCNVFSAFLAAGAIMLMFQALLSLEADVFISFLTVILIGLTTSFWENALVTEVFSLNSFFVALLLLCLVKEEYLLASFLFGLGLGNHQVLLFLLPVFFVVVIPAKAGIQGLIMSFKDRFKNWIPAFAGMTGMFLLGLSIYLVLPIRAAKQPPLNWGQPTTVYKLYRTITRQDYGSLKLSIGETPERNVANAARHVKKFVAHMRDEVPLPALLLALWGLGMGFVWRPRMAGAFLLFLFFSGPFFFWLGNLPFNAQSDGIIGRFLIMPVIALLLAIPWAIRHKRWTGSGALIVCIVLAFQRNVAQAEAMRSTRLVFDYGTAMLRTLPPNGALFMDGGDDAFYSLAMLHYVMGRRSDVELHDRGGLVFKNPYGADFRMLSKEEKQERRVAVEKETIKQRPVYYATMDPETAPGVALSQAGILMKVASVEGPAIDWPLLMLRSLYPLQPDLYRMRALGAFFPYMRGREQLNAGALDEALRFFRRAQQMGPDIDWLQINLANEYAHAGYRFLVAGRLPLAERVYRQWLSLDPMNVQAQSNLGVVLERSGRIEEAKEQYRRTAALFPTAADPVFNLAVLSWKAGDWPMVVADLEEVLRRKPDHVQAQGYLKMARERMKR